MDLRALQARRRFLTTSTMGIGSLALTWLLSRERACAAPEKPPLEPIKYDLISKPAHYQPRARAMISLFMQGGPSHIDLFDPKPVLDKFHGKPYPGKSLKLDSPAQAGSVLASPWKFSKHGQCGMEMSELIPHMAGIADEISLIRSMHTGVNNHGQSVQALNTGRTENGQPSLGSWITYGLGADNQNLPAYMALVDPAALPVGGIGNWTSGWLPSVYQGTVLRPREPRILNLDAPFRMQGEVQEEYLSAVERLNNAHLARHQGEFDLSARIASYELAARMQVSAKEALDLSGESEATKNLYGLDDPITREYGTRCLIARRLVERGVRFVQVFTQNQYWDHHSKIKASLPTACQRVDKPAAALVLDLKSRGLLDSTLVHWGGEMGRLPIYQGDGTSDKIGRDHNTYGFSMWLAGGGVKGGYVHGATDEFGYEAVTDVVTHHDYHATLLHLFGLDPKRLTFQRNNREQNLLNDAGGQIVSKLLA